MEDETSNTTSNRKIVKATLNDGTIVYVQAQTIQSEEDIASITASFKQVTKAIEDIASSLTKVWENAKPRKASVEFAIDFAYESGEVLAMFVHGSTSGSMKITLEWGEPSK